MTKYIFVTGELYPHLERYCSSFIRTFAEKPRTERDDSKIRSIHQC